MSELKLFVIGENASSNPEELDCHNRFSDKALVLARSPEEAKAFGKHMFCFGDPVELDVSNPCVLVYWESPDYGPDIC